MEGTGLTASVLQNIELDRRANIDVSQVLNLAMTLGVPVSYLLAPMARSGDPLDLPNLGPGFEKMTASAFDSWLSSIAEADYIAATADERSDRAQLQALRELQTLKRELRRSEVLSTIDDQGRPEALRQDLEDQLDSLRRRIQGLQDFLVSAGWEV